LADHSPVSYTAGLNHRLWLWIRHRSVGTDFTILRSAEVNLSPSGEGDIEPVVLRKLDLVLGCFHSALRRVEDQTTRYIAARKNPEIHVLGHPQGRIYDHREGLQADWRKVFAEAARLDKAVEIDGYADRQDLRPSLLKIANEEGVRRLGLTEDEMRWLTFPVHRRRKPQYSLDKPLFFFSGAGGGGPTSSEG
jgi:hypothetical protein